MLYGPRRKEICNLKKKKFKFRPLGEKKAQLQPMFNVHSICLKHIFKAYYSMFNSSEKGFLRHGKLCFRSNQSPYASSEHGLSRILTTRNHRNSSPENEKARLSENFLKFLDHFQSGQEAVPLLLGLCEVVLHLP